MKSTYRLLQIGQRPTANMTNLSGVLLVFIGLMSVVSCNSGDQQKKETAETVAPANASKHSDAFNASMRNLLNGYDSLKMALVDYDTTRANAAATLVVTYLDSLNMQALPSDSTGHGQAIETARGAIKKLAAGLMSDTTLELKKRRFEKISADLYALVKSVQYDRQVIYHQHCPMAFKDEQEAYWISTSPVIVNPYLGRKHPKYKDAMLGCGDVTDSLDYSK